jgi:D-aminoacyl-tRNA deacylase
VIALIQRVREASVEVAGSCVASIGHGLVALVGMERDDDERRAERLLDRVLGYRVFADAQRRMNMSLLDVGGGLLLVPQFTLAADTRKGTRPGFSAAAEPERAQALFEYLSARAQDRCPTQVGRFGSHMQVHLVNDGPVTFWLQV